MHLLDTWMKFKTKRMDIFVFEFTDYLNQDLMDFAAKLKVQEEETEQASSRSTSPTLISRTSSNDNV